MMSSAHSQHHDQSRSLKRRSLLQWLGASALILPAALAACANATPPSKVKRGRSYITGEDHRKGRSCWNLCDSDGRYNR
jgi:hypothetical protein